MRKVAIPAALLSTIGVAVTAFLTGFAAHELFDLAWPEAILLGSVVASTDAAAVFATMRFTHIRRKLARTLEGETGLNDPTAIALTIGLIEWIDDPTFRIDDLLFLMVKQLGIGLVIGVLLGFVAMKVFANLPASVGSFAPVASVSVAALSYGVADVLGGSGFLAVYIVGLAVGSTPSQHRGHLVAFHEGLAFLAQVTMFVVLGLLVFPSDLTAVMVSGFVLALLLVVVIRPLAVWASTAFSDFTPRERTFLGWAGLRGAVPIVLGTFVLSEHVDHGETIFNAVFFVVLVSALVQGTTLEWVAARLQLVDIAAARRSEAALGRRGRAARPDRVRGERRRRDRRLCRPRARAAAKRARRGDRPRQVYDPASRQHRDRARRPALRAHPTGDARSDRRRLQPLAQARLAMTVLCCPDKFRGSLTATEAAAAMCRGVERAGYDARPLPLADGGEGTLAAILGSCEGTLHSARVTGPDGRPVTAEWAALADGTGNRRDGPRQRPRARRAQRPADGDDVRHRRAHRRRDRPRLPPGDRRRRRLGDHRRRAGSARRARLDAARGRRRGRLRRDDHLPRCACDLRPAEGCVACRRGGARGAAARSRPAIRRALRRERRLPARLGRCGRPRRWPRSDRRAHRQRVRRRRGRDRLPRSARGEHRGAHRRGEGRCLDADGQGRRPRARGSTGCRPARGRDRRIDHAGPRPRRSDEGAQRDGERQHVPRRTGARRGSGLRPDAGAGRAARSSRRRRPAARGARSHASEPGCGRGRRALRRPPRGERAP